MLTPTERQAIIDAIDSGEYDLEDALDDIAVKQRGEDVRKSIFAGILLANESGEGAVDPKARQLIALNKESLQKEMSALQKQMAEFIANNSGTVQATKITETSLFAASSPSKADYITVSDDVNNYDYIDIRYAAFGRTGLVRLKPSDMQSGVHWTEFENEFSVAIDTGATAIRKITFSMYRIDSDTLASDMRVWRWTGVSTDNGVIAETIGSSWAVGIYSVTGVKYETVDVTEKDAELTDLRVGYDDTEYESAGEALRAQISALWEAINAINITAVTVDENGYLRFDGGE